MIISTGIQPQQNITKRETYALIFEVLRILFCFGNGNFTLVRFSYLTGDSLSTIEVTPRNVSK